MQITILGTGCMLPTKERNPIAVHIHYKKENILFDCGEGTQRQLKIAGLSPAKITKMLISHWHGDHIFGLPGLLLTMGASQYQGKLELYGPKKSKERYQQMQQVYVRHTPLDVKVTEVGKGTFLDTKDYKIEALPLEHSTHVVGYSFIEKDKRKIKMSALKKYGLKQDPIIKKLQQGKDITWKGRKIKVQDVTTLQKGKKVTLITDTEVCPNIVKLAKNADVLICEATHLDMLKDKAKEFKHLTAKQVGQLAKKAKVKKLVLMHFSQRYKSTKPLEQEAKKYFKNTICAKDFYTLKI